MIVRAAALCLALSAIAPFPARAAEPVSIYGIELGKPLHIPECESIARPYSKMCFTKGVAGTLADAILPPKPGEMKDVFVNFPDGKTPSFVKGSSFSVGVIDGKVESVTVVTTGLKVQDTVLQTATAKFGPPDVLGMDTSENAFGAHFKYPHAIWHRGDVEISVIGVINRIDTGILGAHTAKATAALMRKSREEKKNEPQL